MGDFQSLFGRNPMVTADAPGRVNLIGEHTDYNGGFVLPMAIPQRTRVELAPRQDLMVRVWSGDKAATDGMVGYTLGAESPRKDWLDYIQGVTHILHKEGQPLAGFDARIESTVPLGSGVSSSASLAVSLMRALRKAFALRLDDVQIARIGQRAENEFVGARVGIMDPMAASLADDHTALFLDARSLAYERVPLPPGAELIVVHSGVTHRLAGGGGYNTRRAECEQACSLLNVKQLRDLTAADLPRINALPEPLNRRARHVVTEDDRVLEAVKAMRGGNLRRLGELFYASHASMRDDYQVSVPEIDLIVELARLEPAVYGARLTGGGFGGSVVMLAQKGKAYEAAERIARQYVQQIGGRPRILVPKGRQIN
ncbi:MAG TPA: galactokinase [Gemmataceae bacterium]|nr:galactokinase [Gemmataceae bacterium]